MQMKKFVEKIQKIFDELSKKEKSLYNITITNKYSGKEAQIEYNDYLPKIKVYDMIKLKNLEKTYENMNKLQEILELYQKKYNNKIHFIAREGKILVGKGKLNVIGKYKVV